MRFLFIFSLLAIFGFNFFSLPIEDKYMSEEENEVNKTLNTASDFIEKKYSMRAVSLGSSMPGNLVMGFSFGFEKNKLTSIDEVRVLLFQIREDILEIVNKNIFFAKCAKKFPFESNTINVSIFFFDDQNRKAQYPHISVASLFSKALIYTYWHDKLSRTQPREEIEESIEEALKIINESK